MIRIIRMRNTHVCIMHYFTTVMCVRKCKSSYHVKFTLASVDLVFANNVLVTCMQEKTSLMHHGIDRLNTLHRYYSHCIQ